MGDIEAWLEKQKEASKAIEAVERIDKYIDEHLANAHDMKDSDPDKKYYRGWDDALGKMSGILQDVYSDEKQKDHFRDDAKMVEQKPAGEQFPPLEGLGAIKTKFYDMGFKNGFDEGVASVKPAEWDEYTKTGLGRALQIIEKAKGTLQGYQSDDGIYECDKAIECLEHFLYRGLEIEKSAEWSEEDSKRYVSIRTALETSAVLSKEDYDANVVWLRDLVNAIKYSGPKPSWKPSEEELVALKCAGGILSDYGHSELAKTVFMIEGKLANLAVLNKSIWKPSVKQMGALSWMLENARGNIDFDPLKDLYEQLKKLM